MSDMCAFTNIRNLSGAMPLFNGTTSDPSFELNEGAVIYLCFWKFNVM